MVIDFMFNYHLKGMNISVDIQKLLGQVKSGEISVSTAEKLLKDLPYEDIGFAKLDHHRALRSGFGEVVYCAGKTAEQVARIFKSFASKSSSVLGTRAIPEQFEAVSKRLSGCTYDATARTIQYLAERPEATGLIAVCTGGTSDMPVAEECAATAEFFGSKVSRFYDVGVAGIHRLFSQLDDIRKANCVVAAAGMEGALAGVIAGLVDVPVIAVPTSVGYGANFGGLSALLTMLNSCAEGVSVVNIDNGFGAGYLAAQINRLAMNGGNTK